MGWRQLKTTGETVGEKVVVRQFAGPNNGTLAGVDPVLDKTDTEEELEIIREAEESLLHRMAMVDDIVEMRLGNQNLRATQKESRSQHKQMAAVEYFSDTEDVIKASWSTFQHDGAAAFELSQRSQLPPALSAKDFPGGQTQVSDVRRITRINHHLADSDGNRAHESSFAHRKLA